MRLPLLLFTSLLSGCSLHQFSTSGYIESHDIDHKYEEVGGMTYEYNVKTHSGAVALGPACLAQVPIEDRKSFSVHITNNGIDFVALYKSSDGQKAEVIRNGESKIFSVFPPNTGFFATTQRSETPDVRRFAPLKMQISFSGLPKGLKKTNLLERASQ